METVNSAAAELLESSPGDEASHLRDQLDHLNQSWESLLLKTQERQKLLEAALQQVLTKKHLWTFMPVEVLYSSYNGGVFSSHLSLLCLCVG